MAYIFNSREEAEKIKEFLRKKLAQIKKEPVLEVALIGTEPVSESYLKELKKLAAELKIRLLIKKFSEQASFEGVASFLRQENQNKNIDGLLIQVSPVSGLFERREEIINLVTTNKDLDYLGKKFFKDKNHLSSVCQAVLLAIKKAAEILSIVPQKTAVLVVGNQGFWGRRVQQTLINYGFENVVGVDKETTDLMSVTKEVDILISCVGRGNLIKEEMVKKGAIVIDVGFSLVDGKLVGDVAFDEVKKKAGFITPVPGGIGPLSVILVFKNLLDKIR